MQEDLFKERENQNMSDEVRKIYDLICHHREKKNGIKVKRITALTGIPDRSVRDTIKVLVETYNQPIGSGSSGFFIAQSSEEILEVYHNLLSRAFSILKRAKVFKNNAHLDEALGQLRMELKPS
jgi:3-dehydroquinate synthase class II